MGHEEISERFSQHMQYVLNTMKHISKKQTLIIRFNDFSIKQWLMIRQNAKSKRMQRSNACLFSKQPNMKNVIRPSVPFEKTQLSKLSCLEYEAKHLHELLIIDGSPAINIEFVEPLLDLVHLWRRDVVLLRKF